MEIKKGEYLMREGEISNEMYYVNSGSLGVFKRKGSHEQEISKIIAGELVGEMSFLDDAPRSATVQALEDCELTAIPKDKLNKYLATQPKWFKSLVTTLTERLRKANQRVRV
jgi:CRP/FNR family cyclic AMP-dependent transcriptional regulator